MRLGLFYTSCHSHTPLLDVLFSECNFLHNLFRILPVVRSIYFSMIDVTNVIKRCFVVEALGSFPLQLVGLKNHEGYSPQ